MSESKVISKFLLRLPSDIKTLLEAQAKAKGVSLNSLIVDRLSSEAKLISQVRSTREPVVVARPPKPKSGGSTPTAGAAQIPGVVRGATFEGCGHQRTVNQTDQKVCLDCGASRVLNTFTWHQPA